ncbi:hypothetical protein CEE45_07625 [Candidatus Heimdallarchaeota archaeon B3_Heim]|nr:MAG: hypothetical protein CEE45_07625 [Candidatus Heimdallarchaeota archaeon B3_Heim]
MVSFNELEIFLGFFVFTNKGRPLIAKDFRPNKDADDFSPKQIFSLLQSAFDLSQGLKEEKIDPGQIFYVDFSSMRIAGILRSEGLFALITSASASLLDIEFKLRTLMTLFLGSFSYKFGRKSIRITSKEKKEFDGAILTVMAGESRYMGESMKQAVDAILVKWMKNEEAIQGVCISSFTGAVIVNRMDSKILPAAVRAIRGAFAAHLEQPVFFLAVSGVSNIFVYILGEGLLLLVDANPKIAPSAAITTIESKITDIKQLII